MLGRTRNHDLRRADNAIADRVTRSLHRDDRAIRDLIGRLHGDRLVARGIEPVSGRADPLNALPDNDSVRQLQTVKADLDARLKAKAQVILAILAEDPFRDPPPFEKLVGDLAGAYSRRINIQHRVVYEVVKEARTVKVLRMWTHYD